jgi:hypothetical protein
MFMFFHLLETCIMNPSMLFMSFSPSHRLETTMPTVGRALIFTRWRVVFPSYQKLSSLLPNCWRSIFNIFAKNQRWQLDGFVKLVRPGDA